MGQQVEEDSLRNQGVGAGDQRLGGDDRRGGAEQDGEGTQHLRQHQEEGVEVVDVEHADVAAVLDDPRALAEIVEDQAELDKGPAGVDVFAAHVAHVRVECFRAGGGEEDAAQDHKAGLVVRA